MIFVNPINEDSCVKTTPINIAVNKAPKPSIKNSFFGCSENLVINALTFLVIGRYNSCKIT